ncbi:hypothetical protein F4604DRAFT_1759527, partial [Suillus subluteus]
IFPANTSILRLLSSAIPLRCVCNATSVTYELYHLAEALIWRYTHGSYFPRPPTLGASAWTVLSNVISGCNHLLIDASDEGIRFSRESTTKPS